ncbi:TPA: MFS transporter [Candidatus Poribacteria bacterium]|nr:MFS transporter [Candidatus Poribacteria bacterium]
MRKHKRLSGSPYASFYFISFTSIGVLVVYMNLYLKRAGLSDAQLGTAAAVPSLLTILSPPIWGFLADTIRDMRRLMPILFLGAAITFPAMLGTNNYYVLLVLVVLTSFFYTPVIPLIDAMTLGYISRSGGDYGRLRLWGSVGFIASTLLFKLILPDGPHEAGGGVGYGLLPVFIYFIAFRLVGAGWAFTVPKPVRSGARSNLRWRDLKGYVTLNLALTLAVAFIARTAMQSYYVFFSIYLDELGVPDSSKGIFWAMGVTSEVGMMAVIGRLIERIGIKRTILLGVTGVAVRLSLYSLRLPIWWIIPVQAFHALTFTAFHVGLVNFMNRSLPERVRASGQTLYNSVVWGLGGVVGAKICGEISQAFGLFTLFRISSIIALFGLILGTLFMREPASTE